MISPCPLLKTQSENLTGDPVRKTLCDLCRHFHLKGWLYISGGGISIRDNNKIYLGPVGTESGGACPLELFVMDLDGKLKEIPQAQAKISEWKSSMLLFHTRFNAGAVLHSHSMNSMLVTWLFDSEFCISKQEISEVHADTIPFKFHPVSIIENSPDEERLNASLAIAVEKYPSAHAVLVRGHGTYFWGKDWQEAQRTAEYYELLFEIAVQYRQQHL